MEVSRDDPAGSGPLLESIFNGVRGNPLVVWIRGVCSMTLLFETLGSGGREGDPGGRAGNKVFASSVGDTSGTGEIADTFPEEVVIGGK